jgi:hypothetical protein
MRATRPGAALYHDACCQVLDGNIDAAFATLAQSIAEGWRDLAHMDADADLIALRADARWPGFAAAAEAQVRVWERTLGDPALRRELLLLVIEDQAARTKAHERIEAVDRKTTARMKEAIAAHGWPGERLVGHDGAHAAWLLIQHADLDRPFQKACLALLEQAVRDGDARAADLAYLVDRVAVGEGRPQVYGTQFTAELAPQPIEDEAHVDERRASVGLAPFAEYRAFMLAKYGPPAT